MPKFTAHYMEERKCDYCGEMDFYYHRMSGTRINGTLCDSCSNHIPKGFFTHEEAEWSEEWTMIMLKLGGDRNA